jgi:hypothetical protein
MTEAVTRQLQEMHSSTGRQLAGSAHPHQHNERTAWTRHSHEPLACRYIFGHLGSAQRGVVRSLSHQLQSVNRWWERSNYRTPERAAIKTAAVAATAAPPESVVTAAST